MTTRDAIIATAVIIIMGFTVYNSITDHHEMQEHHAFFEEMKRFANSGARFTAADGEDLCTEINKLKFYNSDLDLVDCEKYGEGK